MKSFLNVMGGVLVCLALLGGRVSGATFGYAGAVDTYTSNCENNILGIIATLSENAIPTSMTVALANTTSVKVVRGAIWLSSDSSLVMATDMIKVPIATGAYTLPFNHKRTLPSGTYIIGIISASGTGTNLVGENTTSPTYTWWVDAFTFAAWWPNPTIQSAAPATRDLGIFVTYDADTQGYVGVRVHNSTTARSAKGFIVAAKYTTPAGGTFNAVSINPAIGIATASTDGIFKGAVYLNSDTSLIDTTYWTTLADDTASNGGVQGFRELRFTRNSGDVTVSLQPSTDYLFCVWADSNHATDVKNTYITADAGSGSYVDQQYWPDGWPATLAGTRDANDLVDIFVNGTVVVAGGFNPRELIYKKKRGYSFVRRVCEVFAGSANEIPF